MCRQCRQASRTTSSKAFTISPWAALGRTPGWRPAQPTTTWTARKNVFKDLSQTHAPLSTFAAVIKIAFAYGLISAEDYEDFELVRRLRNEAAHTIYDFSFEDHGVQEMVIRLKADEGIRR